MVKQAGLISTLLIALAVSNGHALAQCAVNLPNVCPGTVDIQTVNFVPTGAVPSLSTTEAAIDVWASGCYDCNIVSGYSYPELTASSSDNSNPNAMNVFINYAQGQSTLADGSCGHTNTSADTEGRINGADITIFQTDGNGNSCSAPQWVAHEIGHVLGLDDVASIYACDGTIMGYPPDDISQWTPSPDDCQKVSDDWYTPEESNAEESCEETCRGTCDAGECTDEQPSPILIDIGGRGYHLTSVENGVRFDLNADGHAEQTSWTRDAGNAFLCLDRNHNGIIESGRELFGDYTLLPNGSEAFNGYQALAVYDVPNLGGNGNGWIDPGDAIWPFLRLWIDTDHDGISRDRELLTLDAAGVLRIDTHHVLAKRRDQFGNLFRYRSRCVIRDRSGVHERLTYDVFLVAHP